MVGETSNARARDRQEAVFAAADELADEGEKITVSAIVDRIGGSNTTATKYLRQWRAERESSLPAPQRLIQRAYQEMSAEVQAQLEAAQRRAEQAEDERDRAKADAAEALRSQQQANQEANIAIKRADARTEAADKAEAEAQRREAAAEASDKAQNQAVRRAEKAEQQALERAQSLDGEISRLKESRESLDRTAQELVKRFATVTEQLAALADRQGRVEEQLAGVSKQGAAVIERVEQVEETLVTNRRALEASLEDMAISRDARAREIRQATEAAVKKAGAENREALEGLERNLKHETGGVRDQVREAFQRLQVEITQFAFDAHDVAEARAKKPQEQQGDQGE